MDNFNVYKDIKARTDGEFYLGVVGPVRTGKSTFIKRFMELDVYKRQLPSRASRSYPLRRSPQTAIRTSPCSGRRRRRCV